MQWSPALRWWQGFEQSCGQLEQRGFPATVWLALPDWALSVGFYGRQAEGVGIDCSGRALSSPLSFGAPDVLGNYYPSPAIRCWWY